MNNDRKITGSSTTTATGRRRGAVKPRRGSRRRGVAAILAMMFLVIFAALAAAMAIVAEGNLAVASNQLNLNQAVAATETGLTFITYRINAVTPSITTRTGLISSTTAPALWTTFCSALLTNLQSDSGNNAATNPPHMSGSSLIVGPIATSVGGPTFTITLTPHPLAGENYGGSYYQRQPYNGTDASTAYLFPAPISATNPLDATWVRCRVDASDGTTRNPVQRSIQVDFKMTKLINYAILARSRVMIGRNVMIQGNIGSTYAETNLPNGHPVQMVSDFSGLDPTLDASLAAFRAILATNDKNGDNRINVNDPSEMAGLPSNFGQNDKNSDGYVDDYDYFLARFDTNGNGYVTATELNTSTNLANAQLLSLIDNFYGTTDGHTPDGQIGTDDRYAKIQGSVEIAASLSSWQSGAANGMYQNYFEGPIVPNYGQSPLTFQATDPSNYQYSASDFDVSEYSALATGNLATQAAADIKSTSGASLNTTGVIEAVPYGSPYPYDYYIRPVYTNMTFTNVTIPQGTNALFENCTFIGVTYVATNADTSDPNYNYVGMTGSDGITPTHADRTATVSGYSSPVTNTKTISNNIRFDGCTFKGSVVSAVPSNFTQTRDKLEFTGNTTFADMESPTITSDPQMASIPASQVALMAASPILTPNYSVELGTLTGTANPPTVTLNGTLVAGIIDIRGQVTLYGTILTTYQPQAGVAPVLGNESPNYNTTIGYFASAQGDEEEELPTTGMGKIAIHYDPTRPLPDGILSAIQLTPIMGSYFEGGAPYAGQQ